MTEDPRDAPGGFGSWRHHLRYRFDNLLARGTWATLVWLGIVTLLAVLASSLLLAVFRVGFAGSESVGWLEDVWQSLLRVMDPGTMASDTGWGRRVLALLVTVFGLLVAGTLIGIIASGVEDRIDGMRRGRSVVIESGHLVVLGSSDQLPGVVRQVALGVVGGSPTTVVVLADEDPALVDHRLRGLGSLRRSVRLVLRSGDPTRADDLELVRPRRCRGVVVLHDGGSDDARVVRRVLAVQQVLGDGEVPPAGAGAGPGGIPVVVEVREAATPARLVAACGPTVHPLFAAQALVRVGSFAMRGPELALAVDELLQVGGADIHVREAPDAGGGTFGSVAWAPTAARPIGVVGRDGRVVLHPDDDRAIGAGERLVVVGRPGDDALAVSGAAVHVESAPRSVSVSPPAEGPRDPAVHGDRLLVVGWSTFGAALVADWSRTAGPDARIEVVVPAEGPSDVRLPAGIGATVDRVASLAGHLDERGLERLDIVVVLPSDRSDPGAADTQALLDLGIVRRCRGHRDLPRVLVQLHDVDHVPLARLDGMNDWLIDPGATAQLLVQLVDQPARRDVLLDLYHPDGPSLDVVSAGELGLAGHVDAERVVSAGRQAGLIAIGWCTTRPGGRELPLAAPPGHQVDLGPDDVIVVVT